MHIAYDLDVGMDDDGNALVVWAQYASPTDSARTVKARRYRAGVGWDATVELTRTSSGSLGSIRLGMSAGGAIAAWEEEGSPSRVAHFVDTGWQTSVTLSDRVGTFGPSIAVTPSGNAILAGNRNDEIRAFRYEPANGWLDMETIGTSSNYYYHAPAAAIAEDGRIMVIWVTGDRFANADMMMSALYLPGSGWQSPVPISTQTAAEIVGSYQLEVSPAGVFTAVWQERSPDSVRASDHLPGSGGWTTAVPVYSASVPDAVLADLSVNVDGNAMVVGDVFQEFAWGTARGFGAGWQSTVQLDPVPFASCRPRIVSAGGGRFAAVYQVREVFAGPWLLWTTRYQPGAGWGVPEPLQSSPANEVHRHDAASSRNGMAIAVWFESSGLSDLRARVFE